MLVYLREQPRALILCAEPALPPRPAAASGSASAAAGRTSTALVLSTAANTDGRSTGSTRAAVEMVPVESLDLASLTRLTQRPALGCLGLMNVGQDFFAAIVTAATLVGSIRPGEEVMRITSVSFFCVNRNAWDQTSFDGYGDAPGPLDPQGYAAPLGGEPAQGASSASSSSVLEHPCSSLRKLLATGTFYYARSGSFDISSRLDRRYSRRPRRHENAPQQQQQQFKFPKPKERAVHHDISNYDDRFVWNSYMIEPLMSFRQRLDAEERRRLDSECFLLLVIQGFVGTCDWPAASSAGAAAAPSARTTLAVVSRLSWKRAGTRFNTRGIDDDGNVANFVESETLLTHDAVTFSHTQVRGSVPLFWEQQGLQAFNARIQVTRPRIASQPAFDRHFAELLTQYRAVHSVNLLGTRDAETVLSAAYAEHMRFSNAAVLAASTKSAHHGLAAHDDDASSESEREDEAEEDQDLEKLGLTNFDFHATSRLSGGLDGVRNELKYLGPVQLKKKAFLFSVVVDGGEREGVYRRQAGVFRTNCLDCLDRTNVVQDMLSQSALESFFEGAAKHSADFEPYLSPSHAVWTHHRVMWAENGDALSRIYAGTGALNSSYTRAGSGKKTLGGFLSDAAKSAGRMYINNFQDKSKQNVIDALLGNMANQRPVGVYDPLHDEVQARLVERLDEYSTTRDLSLFVGTWNLAGRAPTGESLLPWLFPDGTRSAEPDVLALGFQEVVPLTPQQILMTDPDKIRVWEGIISDTLARRAGKQSDYVLLRSEQLVGTALVVFVKESLIGSVRSVEAVSKKTGLKGMSGNKGGVAIRLSFFDTTVCFVTAHFAAGASNVDERNADYWTLSRGLAFPRGKTIASHDYVIWAGDFNYRVDGGNEFVRPLCAASDTASLYANDQLGRARAVGAAFAGYEEAQIRFLPTYKYDFGSNTYDSSEKARVPAWTDRILSRGSRPGALEQLSYARAELRTSDHRPVYATFRAEARIFDHDRRNAIRRALLAEGKASQARAGGFVGAAAAAGTSSGSSDWEEDLPEPSSDMRNWWDTPEASSDEESSSSDEPLSNPFSLRGHRSAHSADAQPTARRAPPRPPQRGDTIRASAPRHSHSISAGNGEAGSTKRAPPIPAKPAVALSTNEEAAPSAFKPPAPARPQRPGMSSRSTSYSSVRSARSLIDGSDSDDDNANRKLGSAIAPDK